VPLPTSNCQLFTSLVAGNVTAVYGRGLAYHSYNPELWLQPTAILGPCKLRWPPTPSGHRAVSECADDGGWFLAHHVSWLYRLSGYRSKTLWTTSSGWTSATWAQTVCRTMTRGSNGKELCLRAVGVDTSMPADAETIPVCVTVVVIVTIIIPLPMRLCDTRCLFICFLQIYK